MKKRVGLLILVGILSILSQGNAATAKPIYKLSVKQIEVVVQQDTIQPRAVVLSTKKIKKAKKSWLPKIRLRFLVVLFREKLKERDRRKLKPVYPLVDSEKKKEREVSAK